MAPPSRYSTPVSARLPSPKRKPTSRSSSGSGNGNDINKPNDSNSDNDHHHRSYQPRSPSREEENSIRRGAEIIRRQIQQQLLQMEETVHGRDHKDDHTHNDEESPNSRVTPRNRHGTSTERCKEHNRPWKEEYAWKAPSVRKGDGNSPTTAAVPLTDSSQGSSSSGTTVEEQLLDAIGPPDESSVEYFSDPWTTDADAAVDSPKAKATARCDNDDDPTDPYESSSSSYSFGGTAPPFVEYTKNNNGGGGDSISPVRVNVSPRGGSAALAVHQPFAPKAVATTELLQPTGRKTTLASHQAVCFLSSDEEDDDDDDDDILEVNGPMFDPFYEQDLLPAEPIVKAFVEQHAALTTSPSATQNTTNVHKVSPLNNRPLFRDDVFTYQEGRQAVLVMQPPDQRPVSPPLDGNSSSSSSGPTFPQLHHLTALAMDRDRHSPNETVEVSYRLPPYLESPEKAPLKMFESLLVDSNSDENDRRVNTDDENDEAFESPLKGKRPMSEVPTQSPSNVSQLSTPEKNSLGNIQGSDIWNNYDKLLRDPAYIHAQSAGFVWQSIVGQHVHFPSYWWNGLRGPPIGEEGLPWIYFGRHTVSQNRVLNQLVKCRASGGRLLLHIVVQDLLTRAPVQDIAIGCFHPNAKGIRLGEQALKRLEDSRDVWMSIRKRNRQSVSATDSLLYSQSNWDGNHSMCRSPLGPGQRVTNTNVRSVFGDKAPLETIFLSEDELYERLHARMKQVTVDGAVSPPMAILQEFVFA